MRAKTVNEAIKHLTPKSEEETGMPYYDYVRRACDIVTRIYPIYDKAMYWYNEEMHVGEDEEFQYYSLIDYVYGSLITELGEYVQSYKTPEEFAEEVIIPNLRIYGDESMFSVSDANESIKHLSGRPEEELYKAFATQQIEMFKQIKEYLISKKIVPRMDPGMLEFYYGDLLFEIVYYEDKNYFTYTIFQNIHDYKTGDEGTYIHKYGTTFTTFEGFKELIKEWIYNTNESIKHLTPHSKEHLKAAGYDEKYANWKPEGSMTLNNWGGIEIKIIDNGDAVEYRFNYGDDDFKPVIEAEIEWGIDEDDLDPEMEDGEPISEPYFSIGEDKYFLKDFIRTDR